MEQIQLALEICYDPFKKMGQFEQTFCNPGFILSRLYSDAYQSLFISCMSEEIGIRLRWTFQRGIGKV